MNEEDCEIRCNHMNSCQHSEIICPANHNCDIEFAASGSGHYATIIAQNSNYLSIISSSSSALYLTDIYGPQRTLNLTCVYGACPHTNIYANHTNEIIIHCDGGSSCPYLRLFTDNVPMIDASCTGSSACNYMQIYQQSPPSPSQLNIDCGLSSCRSSLVRTNSDRVTMDCGSELTTVSSACYDANIYYESRSMERNATILCGLSACEQFDIYALEGIFSVSVLGDTAQSNFKLHCGEIYHQSCDLQPDMTSRKMLCDNDAYCMNYRYNAATDHNIIVSNDYGKYNETITCDAHLNDCAVYCDGRYSCAYSHIMCPQHNPNATCTVYCGYHGCMYSTIKAQNISSLTIYSTYDAALQYVSVTASHLSHHIAVHCDHSGACYGMELTVQNTPQIDIECTHGSACATSDIYYISGGNYYDGYEVTANVMVTCAGSSSCYSSAIHSNAGSLNIDCSGAGACYSTQLYCPESSVLVEESDSNVYCDVSCGLTDSCVGLDVYSINGWRNVRVSSADDLFPESAEMHCDPAYSVSCTMQGNVNSDAWYCDHAEICSDYRMDLNATQTVIQRDYRYYNESISCEEDRDCYIYCDGRYACAYATFACSSNRNCSIYCIGDYSCYGAEIRATTADILSVHSTGNQGAIYAHIYAPKQGRLNMECSVHSSCCQYQTIYASDTEHVWMNCLSSASCQYQLIYAENVKRMEQYCVGSGSCYDSELYQYALPESIEDDHVTLQCEGSVSCYRYAVFTSLPLDVYCDVDNACQYMDLYLANNESLKLECMNEQSCRDINIYSVNGFMNRDLNITSYHDLYANTAEFYCGHGYTKHCALNGLINSNQWVCSDTSSDCYDYEPSDEDTEYIVLDYDYKYADTYIHCNPNKTNCDIICNAAHACYDSKIVCPITTKNGSCSVYCDASPSCSSLEVYAVDGYSQLNMDCNGNDAYCYGITVYCTPYFNRTCAFDSYGQCIGFCGNYTYNGVDTVDLTFADNAYSPNASYIAASSAYKYYNDSILCTGDTHSVCRIECSGSYSCMYASLQFIGNDVECYVSCSEYYSCGYTIINAQNCSSLTIEGSSTSSLAYATVYPPKYALNLDCSAAHRSCEYMKVYDHWTTVNTSLLDIYATCSSPYSCQYQYWSIRSMRSVHIQCSGTYSCIYSDYFIYSVPSVYWNCSGDYACYLNILKTDSQSLSIDCDAPNACYQSEFYIPQHATIHCNHTDGCKQLSLYVLEGSAAFNITSTPNNTWSASNKVYCGESYVESCALQHNADTTWDCDPAAFCYEFDMHHTSIVAQYDYQFYKDEIVCDGNKECYVYCTADYGCEYATIHCPEGFACHVYCGTYACRYAVIYGATNQSIHLNCYASYACSDTIIYASRADVISAECSNHYSCSSMHIFAEYAHHLDVECSGSHSCANMRIYQQYTPSTLTTTATNLNCEAVYSCNSIQLLSNTFTADIICNKDQIANSGCQYMSIYYNGLTENGLTMLCDNIWSCHNNNYYILTGEYGLNITAFAPDNAESNTLHCCSLYTESCTLKSQILSDEWICNDRESLCAENSYHCLTEPTTNIIQVEHEYQYYNKTVQCEDNNKDCEIVCNAPYSCNYASIYCPSGYHCNLYCIGYEACSHAMIDAAHANSLSIRAFGDSSMKYATIFGPVADRRFHLECSGGTSCHSTTLYAPYARIDSLQCSANHACSGMRINADYAPYIHWICSDSYACANVMMFHHDTAATHFNWECNGQSSCSNTEVMTAAQNTTVYCSEDRYSCSDTKIYCNGLRACNITCGEYYSCYGMDVYVVEPVKTLRMMRGDVVFDANPIVLHCGFVHENQCSLIANNDSHALLCESTHICNDYVLDYSRTDYILYEWMYSNYKRNITCNESKMNCEIYCTGSESCRYNTVRCPTNPDSYCTLYGVSSSIRDSVFYAESIDSFAMYSDGDWTFAYSEFYITSNSFRYEDGTTPYGLHSADLYLNANDIEFNCGSNGCSSVSLMIPSNDSNVILNCAASYACQAMTVNATGYHINAEMHCTGWGGCYNMNIYKHSIQNNIYLNCSADSACASADIYSPHALEYDTLDCGTSTACASLTTYCNHPKVNKDCVMEYQTAVDLWICDGDLCYYDADCVDYKKLKVRPQRASILGGDTIVITGPCYNPNVNYTCKFGTEESDLHIMNNTHGYCISPPSAQGGNVLFAVHEDGEWHGMISRFNYHSLFEEHDITIENMLVPNSSSNDTAEYNTLRQSLIDCEYFVWDSVIHMTWDAEELDYLAPSVDITLHQIIPNAIYFESKYLLHLARNISNTGHTEVYLNYTDISDLNMSHEWNMFYPNMSSLSHLLVIMIESIDTQSFTIPMYHRIPSTIMQHITFNDTITSHMRRRLASKGKPMPDLHIRKIIPYTMAGLCHAWKYMDEKNFGRWWDNRRLPSCPSTDPTDQINSGQCEGPWEVDGSCNRNNKDKCDKYHPEAVGCIRSPEGQQCCYKEDHSCADPPCPATLCTEAPCAGTADIASAFGMSADSLEFAAVEGLVGGSWDDFANQASSLTWHGILDVVPFEICKRAGPSGINMYYDRRPADPTGGGGGTAEEACAPVGGDPHFVTFDLFTYTFNGIGDYYYLYHDNLKILLRMQPFNNGSVVTQLGMDMNINASSALNRSASAMAETLEVAINEETAILNVYLNGRMMLFSDDLYGINIKMGDISLTYNELNVIIRCDFGVFIEIWLRNVEPLKLLEFTVDVDAKYENTVSGLIGNYDENDANDLQSRNGTVLDASEATMEQIHFDFGLSWLLNDTRDNNIFHTPFITDIHPLEYRPLFGFEDVDAALLQIAQETCGTDSFECVFDVIATEVVEIANTTLKFVEFAKETADNIKILYNVTEMTTPAPTVEGCTVSESMNVYVLVDTNCNLTTTECADQQTFISNVLQRIKANDANAAVHQRFGYIEFGNGANELVSVHDTPTTMDAFRSLLQIINEETECNTLIGAMNHPLYAIHTAVQRFKEVNNDYNNVILLISGCAPSTETEHSCSIQQEFAEDNIELFVINHNHSGSYECLVNDINAQISNINAYSDVFEVDTIVNSICSWMGVETEFETTSTTKDVIGIQSTVKEDTTMQSMTTLYDEAEEEEKESKASWFDAYENDLFVMASAAIILILILCLLAHWIYIYKLKRRQRNQSPTFGDLKAVEMHETTNIEIAGADPSEKSALMRTNTLQTVETQETPVPIAK